MSNVITAELLLKARQMLDEQTVDGIEWVWFLTETQLRAWCAACGVEYAPDANGTVNVGGNMFKAYPKLDCSKHP